MNVYMTYIMTIISLILLIADKIEIHAAQSNWIYYYDIMYQEKTIAVS